MVEVLPTIAELLVGKAMGEVASEVIGEEIGEVAASACEATVAPTAALPKVGHLAGIFPTMIVDSSSQFHGSPPCADQVLKPISKRAINYVT